MVEMPESGLVRRTFTIREMDLPPEVKLTKRSLLRWFALSSGFISEKESRQTVLDILDALFYFQLELKDAPTTIDIQEHLKKKTGKTVSEKLIRYHLNRLIELNFLQRKKTKYCFNNAPESDKNDLRASFNHWVSKDILKTVNYIETVLDQLASHYKK